MSNYHLHSSNAMFESSERKCFHTCFNHSCDRTIRGIFNICSQNEEWSDEVMWVLYLMSSVAILVHQEHCSSRWRI